ncbi:hypothetical protein [Thermoanaerobacterium thermosaccharolyticum]|uniref:hypothetical protein n=1 Tax=Thermoanaerobacterium thermosaccharolyticum TaxID=1517 RepID=UPI0017856CCD|nr:hypothetical protein [Thermoanaerobacterium thermosaccharolyticum]MBE0069938.1 hypothetical protein [Thermoanaerobacterium thermosaccharolyticum]MBE0228066.1 hypothetical protein [Thermoanaerobacterium thermosaccharolyticum]
MITKPKIKYDAVCPACGSLHACKDWAYVGGKGRIRAIYCHDCDSVTTLDELKERYKKSKIRSYLEIAAYQMLKDMLTVEEFKHIIRTNKKAV